MIAVISLGILAAIGIALFIAGASAGFNIVGGIPTPQDLNMCLTQSPTTPPTATMTPVTYTATANIGPLDMGSAFAPGGLGLGAAIVVDATSVVTANAGTNTPVYTLTAQQSPDDSTWSACGAAVVMTPSNGAAALPPGWNGSSSATASGVFVVPALLTQRYVRLNLTFTNAGTGTSAGSFTLNAYVNTAFAAR